MINQFNSQIGGPGGVDRIGAMPTAQQGRGEMSRYTGPSARPAGQRRDGRGLNRLRSMFGNAQPNAMARANASQNASFNRPPQPGIPPRWQPAPDLGMPNGARDPSTAGIDALRAIHANQPGPNSPYSLGSPGSLGGTMPPPIPHTMTMPQGSNPEMGQGNRFGQMGRGNSQWGQLQGQNQRGQMPQQSPWGQMPQQQPYMPGVINDQQGFQRR